MLKVVPKSEQTVVNSDNTKSKAETLARLYLVYESTGCSPNLVIRKMTGTSNCSIGLRRTFLRKSMLQYLGHLRRGNKRRLKNMYQS